jgi:thiamine-phosphate pyrophosphorylase
MPSRPRESPPPLKAPISYLITSGATTAQTTLASEEFASILQLVAAAVAAKVSLIQIREKQLRARVLCELATRAAALARSSNTRLLVNDRADIARAAGADGVHLTTRSLAPDVVRRTFGDDFLIGVSTHSDAEARAARAQADFVVWGPVFATESKRTYGEPLGTVMLDSVTKELAPFPVIALGGINLDNAVACFEAGASGIAGIRLFRDPESLTEIVNRIEKASQAGKR